MRSHRAILIAICITAGGAGAVGAAGCETATEPTTPEPPIRTEGAGCSDELPTALPYQPGCCAYTVHAPQVDASGFDLTTLGPSPAPLHVHVSWAGPPESSFAVNWKTDNDTLASQLLYGTDAQAVAAADGPTDAVKRVLGHHLLFGGILDPAASTRVHEVHVCGLEPNTTYYYKVGAPGAWSEVYDVATAPVPGSSESYRFAVTGDSRDEPAIFAEIQEAIAAIGVDFQLFTGDVVNISGLQEQWDRFFSATTGTFAAQDLLARVPFLPVNGNHDALSVNYVAQFALPQELSEGETAEGEEWYAFDFGNAHFVVLNDTPIAQAISPAQTGWLEQDLAKVDRQKTPWVFAFHHRAFYGCGGSHDPDLSLRGAWQPIFDAHKVDIVFAGHNHYYQRSLPVRGLDGNEGIVAEQDANGAPVNQSGTLYITTGGAGAPLYSVDKDCPYIRQDENESVRNYVIVEIEGRTLRYTAYRLDGSVLDQFEYNQSE